MTTKKKAPRLNDLGYPVIGGEPAATVAEKRLTRAAMFDQLRDLCFDGSSGLAHSRRERAAELIDALEGSTP